MLHQDPYYLEHSPKNIKHVAAKVWISATIGDSDTTLVPSSKPYS